KDGPEGPLVAEASVSPRGGALRLRHGTYFVQQRLKDRLYEGTVRIDGEALTPIRRRDMRAVAYDQWVRKGGVEAYATALSLWGGAGSAPLGLAGYGVGLPYALTGSLALAQLTLDVSVTGMHGTHTQQLITGSVWSLGAAVAVRKMVDWGPLSVGFGARLGAQYWWQHFDTERLAPSRHVVAPHADTLLRFEYHVSGPLFVGAEAAVRVAATRVSTSGGGARLQFPAAFVGQLGVGWQW
ncbi:MAG TPA: hypothetical protein VFH51_14425, partial [Myxococcota bacterium]|nr:hypothetical protein [Myxococcota bacterium]